MSDRVRATVEGWHRVRPDLDATPLLVLDRLRLVAEALEPLLRAPLDAAGLGRGDLDVLVALRHADPPQLRPGDLQRQLSVTSGAITKRVDRLATRGLVTRRVGADDARTRTITLTDAGARLTDAVVEEDLAGQAALLAGVGSAQRALLEHLLAELLRTLEELRGRAAPACPARGMIEA